MFNIKPKFSSKIKTIIKLSAFALAASTSLSISNASAWSLMHFNHAKKQTLHTTESSQIPFYPYLGVLRGNVTNIGKNFGTPDTKNPNTVEINPKIVTETTSPTGPDGVVIAFVTGKYVQGKLDPVIGTVDLSKNSPDVAAWQTYVHTLLGAGKHVIFSFGGESNTHDLAATAVNNKLGQKDVEQAMQKVLNLFDDPTSTNRIAFDFDIEGGMETNTQALQLYNKSLQNLINTDILHGFTTKSGNKITAGLTLASGLSAPTIHYGQISSNMSAANSYVNAMYFDIASLNTHPGVSFGGDYQSAVNKFMTTSESNIHNIALTFMPGDQDPAGSGTFLSPAQASAITSYLNKLPAAEQPVFTSMWQLSRDMWDSSDDSKPQNLCYIKKDTTVAHVSGNYTDCTNQLQLAWAYSKAFTGNLALTQDDTTPYTASSTPAGASATQTVTQTADGKTYKEGYSTISNISISGKDSSGPTVSRIFFDLHKKPALGSTDTPSAFNPNWTIATAPSKTMPNKISDLLKSVLTPCPTTQTLGQQTCLPIAANSLDTPQTVRMVVDPQAVDTSFFPQDIINVTLPALKNKLNKSPEIEQINPSSPTPDYFYSGHDLWIKTSGGVTADWGKVIYKASVQTGAVTSSSNNTASSPYVHIMLPSDERISGGGDYQANQHDLIMKNSTPDALIGSLASDSINKLTISFQAEHGVCDTSDHDCASDTKTPEKDAEINNIPAVSSTTSVQQGYVTDNEYNTTGNVSTASITDSTVHISWAPLAMDTTGYIKYQVNTTKSGTFSDAPSAPFTSNTSIDAADLDPATQYKITVTPYNCTHAIDPRAQCTKVVGITPETTTFTTKATSTISNAAATIQVAEDPDTQHSTNYADYDLTIKPKSSLALSENWPSQYSFKTGNMDSAVFTIRVQNENTLPAPTCTIMNTDPILLQDNTHAHADGINYPFAQSWFVTSAWNEKQWSCKLSSTKIINKVDPHAAKLSFDADAKKDPALFDFSKQTSGTFNNFSVDLNDLAGAVSKSSVNLKTYTLTFETTHAPNDSSGVKTDGTPNNLDLSRIIYKIGANEYDNTNTDKFVDSAYLTIKQDTSNPKSTKYRYTTTINFKGTIPVSKQNEAWEHPTLKFVLPLQMDQADGQIFVQDFQSAIDKASTDPASEKFTGPSSIGVKEYTYLISRNDHKGQMIYADAKSARPHSRWINYPLWLDNIFRVEQSYGSLSGVNSHLRFHLGIQMPVSKDSSKNGSKSDIIKEANPYDSITTTDYTNYTGPKAKVFSDTTFNPLSLYPADTVTSDQVVPKITAHYCTTTNADKSTSTYFQFVFDNHNSASKPQQEFSFFPDEYDFGDADSATPWGQVSHTGWSVSFPSPALASAITTASGGSKKFGYGAIYATANNGHVKLTTTGSYNGFRVDHLPIGTATAGPGLLINTPQPIPGLPSDGKLINGTWNQQIAPPAAIDAVTQQPANAEIVFKNDKACKAAPTADKSDNITFQVAANSKVKSINQAFQDCLADRTTQFTDWYLENKSHIHSSYAIFTDINDARNGKPLSTPIMKYSFSDKETNKFTTSISVNDGNGFTPYFSDQQKANLQHPTEDDDVKDAKCDFSFSKDVNQYKPGGPSLPEDQDTFTFDKTKFPNGPTIYINDQNGTAPAPPAPPVPTKPTLTISPNTVTIDESKSPAATTATVTETGVKTSTCPGVNVKYNKDLVWPLSGSVSGAAAGGKPVNGTCSYTATFKDGQPKADRPPINGLVLTDASGLLSKQPFNLTFTGKPGPGPGPSGDAGVCNPLKCLPGNPIEWETSPAIKYTTCQCYTDPKSKVKGQEYIATFTSTIAGSSLATCQAGQVTPSWGDAKSNYCFQPISSSTPASKLSSLLHKSF